MASSDRSHSPVHGRRPTETDPRLDSRLAAIDVEARRVWISKLLGRAIGPFRPSHLLWKDETGAFLEATEMAKDRKVRLKVLWPQIVMDDEALSRFVRAMRVTIDLKHPNLIRLIAAGNDGDYCYMASELFDGEPLGMLMGRHGRLERLSIDQVLRVGMDIAAALDHVVARNIVHRDIRPSNILIGRDGTAKLDNLIVAKAIAGASHDKISVVGVHEYLVDLAYMSPEALLEEGAIGFTADIYSLGATLFYALTGQPPFASETLVELGRQIREEPPIFPETLRQNVPVELQNTIGRAMAKDPKDRFSTPGELLRTLASIAKSVGLDA
ncbi:Serine/threonine-protein kinase PrkC [Planctomycetes bacterium Pan216]|uniref:Serine/threonine-protein kinase PrkC n=1 Tax=Kolteria novifilia TaxID=2527975 RepID=A0A518AZ76_9BACT|nr:Serine/threonine-protein kinase PrkC [Planctomycetes bacterium Pan216]